MSLSCCLESVKTLAAFRGTTVVNEVRVCILVADHNARACAGGELGDAQAQLYRESAEGWRALLRAIEEERV